MNQIIVLGNLYDESNVNYSNYRVYDGEGVAPTVGSSNFGHERYVLVNDTYGIVCSIATQVSEDFSLSDVNVFKCLKANVHDIGIVEKICVKNFGR